MKQDYAMVVFRDGSQNKVPLRAALEISGMAVDMKETARQRDEMRKTLDLVGAFTGAVMASPFWDKRSKEVTKPIDDAVRATFAAIGNTDAQHD